MIDALARYGFVAWLFCVGGFVAGLQAQPESATYATKAEVREVEAEVGRVEKRLDEHLRGRRIGSQAPGSAAPE
jgi:hypothetical protein